MCSLTCVLCGSEPELKLQSAPSSPVIDPHLSPNGSMIAFVRDDELYSSEFSDGVIRQLTFGARESRKVCLYSHSS
jgi:dipeptidyl-peptidase 4